MTRTQADVDFEEQQAKLMRFLAGGEGPLSSMTSEQRFALWSRARVMLTADKLLDACEFALTTLSGISSEEFSAGADRIAREHLADAILEANDFGFDSKKRFDECREAVKRSIEINRATTL